jgi:hypothetical protein
MNWNDIGNQVIKTHDKIMNSKWNVEPIYRLLATNQYVFDLMKKVKTEYNNDIEKYWQEREEYNEKLIPIQIKQKEELEKMLADLKYNGQINII